MPKEIIMQNKATFVTIMAGGIGSRFWPASTRKFPKQFIDILGMGKSLLQLTYERFLPLTGPENILILTNEEYRDLVRQQLPDIPVANILCEPSMNNTAPAIAYAALRLEALHKDAVFVVTPSDHVILKAELFRQKIKQAIDFAASRDALVTLGIQPTRPATGYGYIHLDKPIEASIYKVKRFVEKPDKTAAEAYISSGNYLWNAGIFIWSVSSILRAMEQHTEGILDVLRSADYNTPKEEEFIRKHYPDTSKISIDYAVLETAENVYTIPADIGWSDLGTWNALHAFMEKDKWGNAISSGQVKLYDATNNLIRVPKGKRVVLKGLNGYIIVDEGNTLLIYPKEDEQEIKLVRTEIVK